jgi:hypothetical protein
VKATALVALFLATAALPAASPAATADARLRVLLVIDQADDPFAERIRAELVGLGLDVIALEPWRTGEAIESLDAAGRSEQAAAAVRMVPSRKGVEVWMANQPTGRSLLRQLIVDESATGPNEGLVALQTAELLRTSLLALHDPRPPAGGRPGGGRTDGAPKQEPPVPIVTAGTRGEPGPWGVQGAFGALFSPASGDAEMQVWLSVHRMISGRFGIALDGSAPLRTGTVTGPEGTARVASALGGAALFVRFRGADRPVYAILAAGGAVVRVEAEGEPITPFLGRTDAAVTGAAYARADGGFEATSWLRFGLRAVAGAVPAGVKVRFAGNEAGVWGRPFLAALVLADVSW